MRAAGQSRAAAAVMERRAPSGVGDFDFLTGEWDIAHHRLARRLAGSTEWQEVAGSGTCEAILEGRANLEEIRAPELGLVGMTLRLFDPRTETWSLYWATSREGVLLPPVVGRFMNGRGEFFGDDTHEGRPIRVRYIWSDITPTAARWEQAFSADGEKTWETNWIMEFRRR